MENPQGYVNETCPACLSEDTEPKFQYESYDLDSCKTCGHMFVRQAPSMDELAEFYGQLYEEAVGIKSKRKNRRLKYWAFSQYLKTVSKEKPIRLLEIGCNEGDLLSTVKNSKRFDAEGIDYSKPVVEYAQSLGLKAVQKDLFEMEYPDDTFDVVVAIHVVEHMQSPEATLTEILRILKPGGAFFAVMPCVSHYKAKRAGQNWKYINPPHHLWYFSTQSYKAFLKRLGFKVQYVSCLYHRAHLRAIGRKPIES